jgi:hypothetical protein
MTEKQAQELIQKIISDSPNSINEISTGFYLEPEYQVRFNVILSKDGVWYFVLQVHDKKFASFTSDYEKSYNTWQRVISNLK